MFHFRNFFSHQSQALEAETGDTLPVTSFSLADITPAKNVLALSGNSKIGDLYEHDFPRVIAPLRQPELFASFHKKENQSGLVATITPEGIHPEIADMGFRLKPLQAIEPFGEFTDIIRQRSKDIGDAYSWHGMLMAFLSYYNNHGSYIHPDDPEAAPHDTIYTANSRKGTHVLPHKVTNEIFGRSALAYYLDYRLDDPELKQKMAAFNAAIAKDPAHEGLRGLIREAMIEVPSNAVIENLGATIHEPPKLKRRDRERVFAKLPVNRNRFGNWETLRLDRC